MTIFVRNGGAGEDFHCGPENPKIRSDLLITKYPALLSIYLNATIIYKINIILY